MLIRMKRLINENRGQALVELALIMPILIMLLFGIIEFGRVFNAYLIVNNASREGARTASVGADNLTIINKVKQTVPNLDQSKLSVEILPLSNRKRGEPVTVTVKYSIKLYAPLVDIALTNPMPVTNQTTMRVE